MVKYFSENLSDKNSIIKQKILELCMNSGDFSIADFARELNCSVPTTTKIVGELIDDGWLEDLGKKGSASGRRPSIFGLNPEAGFFVGVDLERNHANIMTMDFKGQTLSYDEDVEFTLRNTEDSCRKLCGLIRKTLEDNGLGSERMLACNIDLTGRVNTASGYSFTYFINEDKPLSAILEEDLGVPVALDNDSRAMTYGEFRSGIANGERSVLFINVGWGLGMGMILNGDLYYGKSGFSGEFGHFPFLDNGQICRCGKIGCMETGASGSALQRIVTEKLEAGCPSMLADKYKTGKELTLNDLLGAVEEEDVVAIDAMGEIGTTLGRGIAGLINIFNPEIVILGGKLTVGGDYLMLPVRAAIKKYSLNIVSKDTTIVFSKLGRKAGSLGCCMLARTRFLGLM